MRGIVTIKGRFEKQCGKILDNYELVEDMIFKKATVYGTITGLSITTHPIENRIQLTKKNLQSFLEQIDSKSLMYSGHDVDKPPVGKIIEKELRKLDGGHYGIWIKAEIFDEHTWEQINSGKLQGLSMGFEYSEHIINENAGE